MNKESDTHYKQAQSLDVHEADDGLIIFHADTDRVHHLNSSAGVLFALCDQPCSRASLIESFQALFGLEESDCAAVAATLDQLLAEGVLVQDDGK